MRKFRIEFLVDEEINCASDIDLLRKAISMANDACDCGAKGIVLCQVFADKDCHHAHIVGKFVRGDIAKQTVD